MKITDKALNACVDLSMRYINDRFLPDKAIDLMDEAASLVRLSSYLLPPRLKKLEDEVNSYQASLEKALKDRDLKKAAQSNQDLLSARTALSQYQQKKSGKASLKVTEEDVARVVANWTKIPVSRLTQEEGKKLLHLEDELHKRVVGQDEAVIKLSKAIRRGRS